MILKLILVLILSSGTLFAQEKSLVFYHASQVAYVSSVGMDLASTWTLPKGWREGNPILGKSKARQIGVSSAIGILVIWQAHKIRASGHTKLAAVVLTITTGFHVGATIYNNSRKGEK